MHKMKQTRRHFLMTSAAIGASTMVPTTALAMQRTLSARFNRDVAVLDPGYMSGGPEIYTLYQCLPFLAVYTVENGTSGWAPSMYVTKLEQRDANHIDFELADWLEWSNGYGPVLASDVKYSYERMKGTDWSGYFDPLDRVDVTGERTGTLVLSQPFAPFIMTTLCDGPAAILSEAAMKDVGEEFTTEFPATCGPYLYEQQPGQRATFSPNPDWRGPKPHFDVVQANIISEGKSAELAFEAGELDVTEIASDTQARYLKSMPDGAATTVAGQLNYSWMGMNTEHPKLQDIRVRQAIQHAVDVESILAGAYSGTSTKSNGIICPGLLGQRSETSYSYDPAKAKALLAEAGVSGLELTLRSQNNQVHLLTAQIIQANLAAVGITVTIMPMEGGPFWDMGLESKGDTWKELEIWLMRFGSSPDPYEATQWFVSGQVGVWNWERWSSEEFDKLYDEGISETDDAKRAAIYIRMQEIMEETGAYVWINHEPDVFVHRKDLKINTNPQGILNFSLFGEA